MAYYGQPIIEGLKGLGESIRGYGQTRMQTQLGLGQQQVDMAKMEYEAPLRQMETQMKYTEYQDWLKDQESKKQPVDFSSLMETARQSGDTNKLLRANRYINSLAGIWKLQREGDQLLKSDGTPLTEGDLDEEDVQKAAFAVGQIIKGPEKDTVEEHQKYIANARGYQGWLGQLPGIDTKVFPTAFPEIETSQKRITELGKEKTGKESPIGKMLADLNALPEGDSNRLIIKQAIEKAITPTGMKLEVGADGSITLTEGQLGKGAGLEKATKKGLETEIIDIQDSMSRFQEISTLYNPKFLELKTQFEGFKTKWGEKTGLWEVPAEQKEEYSKLQEFAATSINNLNLYIKKITGAQMSEPEAKRLMKGMPNPGSGLLDGDSATQFEAKWNAVMHTLRMSLARKYQLLKTGFNEKEIERMVKGGTMKGLGSISAEINNFGNKMMKNIKVANPRISQSELRQRVKETIQKQFFEM